MSASSPRTNENLQPIVTDFGMMVSGEGEGRFFTRLLTLVNVIFLLLLAVVCTNVATLVFARTATRSWEITVRNALGASRGRIISQLFIEALVLAGGAAVLGLVIARVSMGWGLRLMAASDAMPFWINASLSWKTVLYAALLT